MLPARMHRQQYDRSTDAHIGLQDVSGWTCACVSALYGKPYGKDARLGMAVETDGSRRSAASTTP